jgi:hypothetical protein
MPWKVRIGAPAFTRSPMATETEPWAQVNKRPPFTDRRDSSVIAKLAPAALRPIGIARRCQVPNCVFYANRDAIAW